QDFDRGAPVYMPRVGPRELGFEVDAEQGHPVVLDVDPGREVDVEGERREDEQRVEADVAVDAEAAEGGVELDVRAELVAVGRDREVGAAAQPRVVAVADADREAL